MRIFALAALLLACTPRPTYTPPTAPETAQNLTAECIAQAGITEPLALLDDILGGVFLLSFTPTGQHETYTAFTEGQPTLHFFAFRNRECHHLTHDLLPMTLPLSGPQHPLLERLTIKGGAGPNVLVRYSYDGPDSDPILYGYIVNLSDRGGYQLVVSARILLSDDDTFVIADANNDGKQDILILGDGKRTVLKQELDRMFVPDPSL